MRHTAPLTRALALAAPLLLTATACQALLDPKPPPLSTDPDAGDQEHLDSNNAVEVLPDDGRPPGLPRYDEDAQPETAAIGSEDLVRWRDDAGLVASDATTDALYLIDLDQGELTHRVQFEEDAAPGRVAASEDTAYVVLQGAGELARVDAQGQVTGRVAVCAAPRGVALDAGRSRAWVACASSEVVGVDLQTFEVASTWFVDADLRDVVVLGPRLYVSRFHAGEILALDPGSGEVEDRKFLPRRIGYFGDGAQVGVLWRLERGGDGVIASYQRMTRQALVLAPPEMRRGEEGDGGHQPAYGPRPDQRDGDCQAAVSSMAALVVLDGSGQLVDVEGECVSNDPLPVDVELGPCGVATLSAAARVDLTEDAPSWECPEDVRVRGNALAMARLGTGELYVLARHELLTVRGPDGSEIPLAVQARAHLGHTLFHANTGSGLTCASCHPGGGSDGHAWTFLNDRRLMPSGGSTTRDRRTQTLRAGVEGKLHWDGEFDGMTSLMFEIFSRRMGGADIELEDTRAIRAWLGQLEPASGITPSPERAPLVAQGAAIFGAAGCGDCHTGANLTDHRFHDVGTLDAVKTPTLRGIVHYKRFLHDGCAGTLRARFDPGCGGDQHGDVEGLSEGDLDALTAYLETL
jgi:mono/diheme cytochrome c family protein